MNNNDVDLLSLDMLPRASNVCVFCPHCQGFSNFVLLDSTLEWICAGDPRSDRDGCGLRLKLSEHP
jgi:hypothetical protein